MAAAATRTERLIERLPKLRGRLTENASLAGITWFRVGGPAELLFKPEDAEDLANFLRERPRDVPVTVLGVGSNLLVRDGGVPGVVIRLGRAFAGIGAHGTSIEAGAGALDLNVALAARDGGIGGLEFLSGIPGTIGGALRMNAGAYRSDIARVFESAIALDETGATRRLDAKAMGFTYRHCAVPEGWIFTAVTLRGEPEDQKAIHARIQEIQASREESQPIRARTGGSTFINPKDRHAWELIDEAGCRGLRVGGAMVSEKHCNFLINTGEAGAAEIEALGEEVRRRVKAHSGIDLEWEIRRIGIAQDPVATKGGAR